MKKTEGTETLWHGGAGQKCIRIYSQAVSFYGSFSSESRPSTLIHLNEMLKNIAKKK